MVCFTDTIYSFYLQNKWEEINELYNSLKTDFFTQLNFHFSEEYKSEIYKSINKEYIQKDQLEINNIFNEFAILFHNNIVPDYLINRNISIDQINQYQLGSTHCLENPKIIDGFIYFLLSKYNKKLVKLILDYHVDIFSNNLQLYGNQHCSTIPAYDLNNNCIGIVYRTEQYKPKDKTFRNLYKFYVSHAPTYLFNLNNACKYDTIFVVEGVFDALSIIKLGFNNVVSSSHNRLSKYHFDLIKDKKIIVLFDNDWGGLGGLEYIYEHYHNNNIKYYNSFKYKDIDELCKIEPEVAKNYLSTLLNES